MARQTLTCSLLALCLLASLPAQAQPGPRDDRGSSSRPDLRHDRGDRADRGGRNDRYDGPNRPRPDLRGDDRDHRRYDRGRYTRGAGPDHRFHRGDRLPWEYRNRTYVVDDWRGHRLSAPPRGYHWVQMGADYVLVAVATGLIVQLLLGQ